MKWHVFYRTAPDWHHSQEFETEAEMLAFLDTFTQTEDRWVYQVICGYEYDLTKFDALKWEKIQEQLHKGEEK